MANPEPRIQNADSAALYSDIAARLAEMRARIERAAARSGRRGADVRLIAVSKTFGIEHIRAAVAAGQTEFGENRVQEALQKIAASADVQIGWHLVGHLQTNKARKAAESFACIHSVDSVELLERLDQAASEAGTSPELLVQVDLAREATKHGAAVGEVAAIVAAADRARAARVRGLMLLPPFEEDPERVRPYFRRLRELRDQLAARVSPALLAELSMGMSHDFETAIEEGATMVRLGTAIFGKRERHV
jgi:pyridoxal phosphate enzyme (YggS family)